jgi:hypothetical protein
LSLDADEQRALLRRFAASAPLPPPALLDFFRAAYLAFHLGRAELGAEAIESWATQDAARLRHERRRYGELLRAELKGLRSGQCGTCCCSAAGTIVGEPSGGGATTGAIWGTTGVCPLTKVSTLVGPPLTHLAPLKVCSQCSFAAHTPLQGSGSHNPLAGLHVVPAVHIAMHPPAAREATAAPMAAALVAAAPAIVFELPVVQPARTANAKTMRRTGMADPPPRCLTP